MIYLILAKALTKLLLPLELAPYKEKTNKKGCEEQLSSNDVWLKTRDFRSAKERKFSIVNLNKAFIFINLCNEQNLEYSLLYQQTR